MQSKFVNFTPSLKKWIILAWILEDSVNYE